MTAVNLLSDPNVNAIMINFHDITSANQRMEKIRFLSYKDPMTKLYNRRFFEIETKRFDQKKYFPISVIVGDLNGLKIINDGFGHAVGDRMLKQTARILSSCCGKRGNVFRFGGDEFAAFLPNTTKEIAQDLCRDIQIKCDKYNSKNQSPVNLSIALGCETRTSQSESLIETFKKAESFMYRNKLIEGRTKQGFMIEAIKNETNNNGKDNKEHTKLIAFLSVSLGKKLGLSEEELNRLELVLTFRDLGKMSIEKSILSKKEALTEDDWLEIKKHPEAGFRIAQSSPKIVHIADYILCHHERWDGKGYPQGITGEEIPLISRIVLVVDAYEAMTSERPYRQSKSHNEAVNEIAENSGTQFDPSVVKAFLEIIS